MASGMRLTRALFVVFLGSATSERMAVKDLTEMRGAEAGAAAASSGAEEAGTAEQGSMLADQVREGALFLGRFRMKQALWAKGLDKRSLLLPLTAEIQGRFQQARELKSGSFGETWAAVDTAANNRPVALKMFYDTVNGQRYHITWAHAANEQPIIDKLRDAAGECLIAQKLQIYATSDPVGASRLMQCYEDHVTCPECLQGRPEGRSTSNHVVSRTGPLYQVLEDCSGEGGVPLNEWSFQQHAQPNYPALALQIFKEVEEGLAYMTEPSHAVKWTHHDLKPENVVVKFFGGRQYVKIIDFGAVTEISLETAVPPPFIVSTIPYAPVEWGGHGGSVNYDIGTPWSFDTYSAGCILHELFSGVRTLEKFLAMLPESEKATVAQMCAGVQDCVFAQQSVRTKQRVEGGITKDWGKAETVSTAVNFLFAQVQPAFVTAANALIREAGPFMGTFVAMMSYYPSQRPTPGQVLDTPFMQQVSTTKDPQFDQADAQHKATVAFKNSGGLPPKQALPLRAGHAYVPPPPPAGPGLSLAGSVQAPQGHTMQPMAPVIMGPVLHHLGGFWPAQPVQQALPPQHYGATPPVVYGASPPVVYGAPPVGHVVHHPAPGRHFVHAGPHMVRRYP